MATVSRRQVLGAGLVAGVGALAGCSSGKKGSTSSSTTGSTVVAAPTTTCAPLKTQLAQIEHVVFLIMENRSFDHYFGTYPGVRGFNDHPNGSNAKFAQVAPTGGSGVVLPFHLDTTTTNASCTNDITHDWGPQHKAWNGGAMDSFATVHAAVDGVDGGTTMGYYTRADIPYHYALADAFTLCDAYHCSVIGPTDPNRLFALSATNDPSGSAGGPIFNTADITNAAKRKFSCTWTTMPERLQANGVSWKVYDNVAWSKTSLSLAITDNRLYYFKQYSDPTSALFQNAFGHNVSEFATDVAAGTLPSVSWVVPTIGHDEHPPASPQVGGTFISGVLSALLANPAVWAKTALFVTYDENGGFFDHVAPPVSPNGTAGETVTISPLPAEAQGFSSPIGLGFRVPMLVLSPFSRGGYVCSDTFDHTSMLRFLETRFGVEVPNLSDWRRSVTGDLTTTLDLSQPDVSAPTLPAADATSAVVARECPANEIIQTVPHYPVPVTTSLPTQEAGTAKRHQKAAC